MATKTIKKKTVTPKPVTDDIETKVDVVEEKEVNTTVDAEKIAEAVVNAVKKSAATETKEYGEEDLILCKSITGGELIYIGNSMILFIILIGVIKMILVKLKLEILIL